MALDAVVFPQDPFGHNFTFKDYFQGIMEDELSGGINYNLGVVDNIDTDSWSYDQLGFHKAQEDKQSLLTTAPEPSPAKDPPVTARRKRRRTKSCKNKEEVENQRMTHIAVERNRRKQMNEYLAVLRTLMPSSYAQRGRHGAAEIEVTMVESHANVKILAKRCSGQLVKLVAAFQSLSLTFQHLSVSSLDHMVMYSVSVKVEEGCELNSVDEIAAAVNQMLRNIDESLG
uniref:BHLH domain-containing protein n=1 Tax=Kalanchoe fedtschenkoi TaxID=63787 RepID=A0A7N0UKB1_KALFE